MCQEVGATTYLAGQGAAAYDDLEMYEKAGIEYRSLNFNHPEYRQRNHAAFLPGLSVIDIIFNLGLDRTRDVFAELQSVTARSSS